MIEANQDVRTRGREGAIISKLIRLVKNAEKTWKARPMAARKTTISTMASKKTRTVEGDYRRTIFTDGRPSEHSRNQPKRIISYPNNLTGQ
jgi:hypothetical protein